MRKVSSGFQGHILQRCMGIRYYPEIVNVCFVFAYKTPRSDSKSLPDHIPCSWMGVFQTFKTLKPFVLMRLDEGWEKKIGMNRLRLFLLLKRVKNIINLYPGFSFYKHSIAFKSTTFVSLADFAEC